MGLLVKRMKADFRPYVNAVLPDAIDRLGTWPRRYFAGVTWT